MKGNLKNKFWDMWHVARMNYEQSGLDPVDPHVYVRGRKWKHEKDNSDGNVRWEYRRLQHSRTVIGK